jgi:hypothetical protein
MYWVQTVLGYPGICYADLEHWKVAKMPLASVAGSNAHGIILTDTPVSPVTIRVATEFAISVYVPECVERNDYVDFWAEEDDDDWKSNSDSCDEFRPSYYWCLAPVVVSEPPLDGMFWPGKVPSDGLDQSVDPSDSLRNGSAALVRASPVYSMSLGAWGAAPTPYACDGNSIETPIEDGNCYEAPRRRYTFRKGVKVREPALPGCGSYQAAGYSCDGDYCARIGCSGDCTTCASLHTGNYTYVVQNGRCVVDGRPVSKRINRTNASTTFSVRLPLCIILAVWRSRLLLAAVMLLLVLCCGFICAAAKHTIRLGLRRERAVERCPDCCWAKWRHFQLDVPRGYETILDDTAYLRRVALRS